MKHPFYYKDTSSSTEPGAASHGYGRSKEGPHVDLVIGAPSHKDPDGYRLHVITATLTIAEAEKLIEQLQENVAKCRATYERIDE